MVFRLFIISLLFTSPVRAQSDCLRFLAPDFSAQSFTAATTAELSDADLTARIPKAAEVLFDKLSEQAVNFTKLEQVLRTNWLVVDGALTEDKICRAFSGPYVRLTFDFFSKLELVLAPKPELAREIREAVLAGLQARSAQEETARGEVQEAVQKVRVNDPRFNPTSTGAVFEPVDDPAMGRSVKDESGRIWSEVLLGTFKNEGIVQNTIITDSEAVKACEKIGGRLPSREDYEVLRAYFDLEKNDNFKMTEQGSNDLLRIFPDMIGQWFFWSSSVHPDFSNFAYGLSGDVGFIINFSRRNSNDVNSVRCVRSP